MKITINKIIVDGKECLSIEGLTDTQWVNNLKEWKDLKCGEVVSFETK